MVSEFTADNYELLPCAVGYFCMISVEFRACIRDGREQVLNVLRTLQIAAGDRVVLLLKERGVDITGM